MYNELYAAWQRENDYLSLGGLPLDFYVKLAEYLRRIKDQNKVFDKESVKINLLKHESENVERMLEELLRIRYRKIIKMVTKSKTLPSDLLTIEEAKMCSTFTDFAKSYQNFTDNLIQGLIIESNTVTKIETNPESILANKRSVIRFLKNIPAIMGADMKSYGPFIVEDVASLPTQNSQILVKQGLAVLVEVS